MNSNLSWLLRDACKRLLSLLPTLLVIIIVSFLIIRLAPGSPFLSDKHVSPAIQAQLERQYGFDKPLWQQLLLYLKNLLWHGDLGLSTKYPNRHVQDIIADGLAASLQLGILAALWALLLGITTGVVAAIRHRTAWDHGAMLLALISLSIPSFVLGPCLVWLFALHWYVLPPAGFGEWRHMVLPAITLGTVYAGSIARLTRAGMLEITQADYVRTARAKGLTESTIVFKHMLKGGLLPVVTYLGPTLADILVGSVVVEKIFNIPGMGPYFVDAALNRDYFLVMGIVLVESCFLLIMNMLVDILYGFLDPRIRYE